MAFVLVPEGIESLNGSMMAIPVLLMGGIAFFVIERVLGLRRRESPQLMGMVLDYVPEAVALGGLMALGSPVAALLAVLVGLQNIPEGFNAYRELYAQYCSPVKTMAIMKSLVALGPIAGLSGYFFLGEHRYVLGLIMLFSSGGILYLVFQDIAPQSRLKKHWAPPLGAVVGFCVVLFSQMVLEAYG
ncbi:divalent cation transporter [Pontibacterium granulatum]|nr:divalent cation transporter [Pontibacterium granulatum]